MKIAAAVILSLALIFIVIQVISSIREEHSLAATFSGVAARLQQAENEEQNLAAEVNYLANPVNLEKEFRARFNYAKPGETMVIIVASSTPTSSTLSL